MKAFIDNTDVIQSFLNDKSEKRALKFRNPSGGNLLFRPIAITEYFNAAIHLLNKGYTYDAAFSTLAALPQDISKKPWRGFLWDGSKMINRISRPTIKSLLIYYADRETLSKKDYDSMLLQYSTVLNVEYEKAKKILNES